MWRQLITILAKVLTLMLSYYVLLLFPQDR
jgi:hypothetical protein